MEWPTEGKAEQVEVLPAQELKCKCELGLCRFRPFPASLRSCRPFSDRAPSSPSYSPSLASARPQRAQHTTFYRPSLSILIVMEPMDTDKPATNGDQPAEPTSKPTISPAVEASVEAEFARDQESLKRAKEEASESEEGSKKPVSCHTLSLWRAEGVGQAHSIWTRLA